ncbi:CRTAC1 family protein [Streptomyces pluripotens]|uniref:CRTAC1 family protein n=1 Tax=Streptomyces pluripotens TaxID=1355015 RepID=A0A221P836_9ACTN|nr:MULTISPECIES: CRTAC1 family protein [Streptomyces]ARP73907.1 RNA-binding protein [Streptomyces pluripotens]ASN28168.1 CRTAC1 family protein [Streptomyces pluripotens]KIE23864.1 RNA-binding protein [Streptomyces sp. MUSC 125]
MTVLVAASLFFAVRTSVAVAGGDDAAAKYKFQEMPIALPPGYDSQHMNTVRKVNPAYQKIRSWISSVGAGIAINDLVGHGKADGMCIVDTRTDKVVVTYTPTAAKEDRFTPFVLDASPLPMDHAMAPTGCAPGDFNGDGRMDLLVSYWGRTPVVFMAKDSATTLSPDAYVPREVVPSESPDGAYHGPRWNTDAVYIGDLDGSGHPSVVVGNYFRDSDVLDPQGLDNVGMNDSLSNSKNAGGDHVLRWTGASVGDKPTVSFVEEKEAIPYHASTGWTLAISGADLTGDDLPEMYIADDFGHDHLLYNRSTPGHIKYTEATGKRTPTTPKSFVLGKGSFKGMGIDFADVDHNGRFDMMVSNITVDWGLEESNFLWMNKARNEADMARKLAAGEAPFTQEAQQHGVAWTGWGWDTKMADFLNNGELSILQATGFVKGKIDRWPWLQEMAMTNDDLLSNPAMWPHVQPGDDIAGDDILGFYARTESGKYANISKQLGLDVKIPSRALATGDTTGTGTLDFAVARQWGPPAFYANQAPDRGQYLGLRLYRPAAGSGQGAGKGIANIGAPAYGATVKVTTSAGTQVSQLDGGGGHSGFRSFDVHFGLGSDHGPATVELSWRDADGGRHRTTQKLTPGTHTFMLTDTAQEVANR